MLDRPDTDQTREDLAQALDDLSRLAREGIPGCAEASVTVLHGGDARTMAATGPRPVRVDERQYESGSGPCLSAMDDREMVSVPDYDAEARWPDVTVVCSSARPTTGFALVTLAVVCAVAEAP